MNDQIKHYADKLAYEIDSWDLKVAIERGEPVIVLDARSPQAYDAEHIPGAISLPHRTMDGATTAALDKASLIVTYCDGIGCNASTKGALNMARLGFRVRELIGGLDWWKRDGHPTEGRDATTSTGGDCGCAQAPAIHATPTDFASQDASPAIHPTQPKGRLNETDRDRFADVRHGLRLCER